jgi:hypothetical protein
MVHPDLGRIAAPRPCAPVLLASQLPTLLSHPSRSDVPAKLWARPQQAAAAGGAGGTSAAHAATAAVAAAAAYIPAAAFDAPRGYVGGGSQRRRPMTAAPRTVGPSERRPRTAGALRGGDGGGHGGRGLPGGGQGYPRPASASGLRPDQRIPAWAENMPPARSLLVAQQPPLDRPKRRRTTIKRPRTAPGHPRQTNSAPSDGLSTTGHTTVLGERSSAAASDKVGMSSVFSAPDSPTAGKHPGGRIAAELAVQAAEHSALQDEASEHRSRPWVNEKEQSRSMVLKMSAHAWKGRRSWRIRCMENGLSSWRAWVEEHQQFVVHTGFALWVWKRYSDRRINQRYAAVDLCENFDALRCRQICRAWSRYTAHVHEMERKWRGLLVERQSRKCAKVLDAWQVWATKQAETGRKVLGAMLRSQHSWMKAMRFAQLRLYAFCRARRRERRKLFGQQLEIGLGGHATLTNVPDLPFPEPLAPAGVDKKSLETIGLRFRQNDIRDLAACQWRFAHQGRRMFLAWAQHIENLKKIVIFTRRIVAEQAFKLFKQRVRWSRTQRTAREEIEEKRRLERAAQGVEDYEDEIEDLMLPSEKKKRRQRKLERERAGTAAAAALRAEQEAEYRARQKAEAELKAREEAEEAETQARIAAIMGEEDGTSLGDLLNAASEDDDEDGSEQAAGAAQGDDGASELAAVKIQSLYRGHTARLGLMDESARELYELRRELAQVQSEIKKLELKMQSMAAEMLVKEQEAPIGELAAIKSAHKDAMKAARKTMRALERERNLIMKDIEALLRGSAADNDDDSEEETEAERLAEEAKHRSKYAAIFAVAAKHVDSAQPHMKQVRRRQKRVSAHIERINAEQERLAANLDKRNSAFASEMERLELRMQERLAMATENPLVGMLNQLCDAFALGLDAVASARLRNHTILAFLRLAKPVQIRKARAHFRLGVLRAHVGVWSRFTAMMRAIRETAHVRFRCFYTWFRRWRSASRGSRIYRSRGLRREVEYRRRLVRQFSTWLHEAPHQAYRCGRYALFTRWIEYVQRRVSRREMFVTFQKLMGLHKRRQAYTAMFLGLKPQHHGERALIGYVEKNLMADLELWQHCLRAEIGLLSDRHRRVNNREITSRKLLGKGTMTARRRLTVAELELKAQIKHEHALSLEAFHEKIDWVPHWGTIFDLRSAHVLQHFAAAKELVARMQRMEKDPRTTDDGVRLLCRSERFRVSIALWMMRARVKDRSRLTEGDAAFLTKSARRFITRFAQDAIDAL